MFSGRALLVLLMVGMMFCAGCLPEGRMVIDSDVRVSRRITQRVEMIGTGWFAGLMRTREGVFAQNRAMFEDWEIEEQGGTDQTSIILTRSFKNWKQFEQENYFKIMSDIDGHMEDFHSPWQGPTINYQTKNFLLVQYFHWQETYPSATIVEEAGVCSSCQGTGIRQCYTCEGQRYTKCYTCGGTGRQQDLWSGEIRYCSVCRGYGWQTCRSCQGKGQVTCTSCGGTGQPDAWDKMGEELARSMLGDMCVIKYSITLPGKIIKSNARSVEGRTAKWSYSILDLEKQRRLEVVSRRINWWIIVLVVGIVVFVKVIRFLARSEGFRSETIDAM